MSGPWVSARLQAAAPVALGGTLSLVGQVRAEAWNLYQLGSAILVRPDVALTAAHVVTFSKEGELWVAGRISVDLGRARVWAQALAIQRPWLQSSDGASDVVALHLTHSVCPADRPPRLHPLTSEARAAVWGCPDASAQSIEVEARREGDWIEYQVGNLPGYSGGPVIVGQGWVSPAQVIGLHRDFDDQRNVDQAVPFGEADLQPALAALQLG